MPPPVAAIVRAPTWHAMHIDAHATKPTTTACDANR